MATKDTTSKRVAKIASRVLRSRATDRACKSLAGSALVQAPNRKPVRKRVAKRATYKRG
jgi:hypothetical protein